MEYGRNSGGITAVQCDFFFYGVSVRISIVTISVDMRSIDVYRPHSISPYKTAD